MKPKQGLLQGIEKRTAASPTGTAFCRFCRWRVRGQEMHKLKRSGYTYREIALAYGLPEDSRSVVMRSINRYLADMKEVQGEDHSRDR